VSRLGFGKMYGGKGLFCYGVEVKVRFLSLNVDIGEEFVVFGLGYLGIQNWWVWGLGG